MVSVLAGKPGVVIYLDDIVVHGSTTDVHDEQLTMIFAALSKHKLTLNSDKCVFSASSVEFVGFQLLEHGGTPLSSNVDAIQAILEPSSAAEVASFLGMPGYYLNFLPHYSRIKVPQLEDKPWVWSPACSDSVRSLNTRLTSAPVLAHFDTSSPTFVT